MAFTLDATIGGATANSYATRDEMIDIADGHIDGELFTDLTEDEQDKYISTASLRINAESFTSIRVNNEQALAWPRTGVVNSNFEMYQTDEIPYALKRAVFEYILFLLKKDDRIVEEMELHDASMLEGYKVGPLDYKFRANAKMDVLPMTVQRELLSIGPTAWVGNKNPSRLAL